MQMVGAGVGKQGIQSFGHLKKKYYLLDRKIKK
jgi:hypothetical protein